MQTAQGTSSSKIVTAHAMFLANVSRHFVSLEIEPMLEAVGRSALCILGDICVVDRAWGTTPTRILEVTATPDAWMEAPAVLAGVTRGEVRVDGDRSRLTVPIGGGGDRYGSISFAKNDGLVHSAEDLDLAQELGERLALAIRNVREHRRIADALGDRERLISIAAHELRGPLCSVRLCLQSLLRSRVPLAPKANRMLEIMAKEERRVARLIDDLLDLGRIRSGQLELDLSSFDLCELVREVSQQMAVQAAGAGSKLSLEMRGPVVGRWDRLRLDQVVTNLVANAIKYGQGRPVIVRASQDGQRGVARLAVTDNGLGIAPEWHGRIFEPFKRGATAGQSDGLGLGLYIVRSIVERLGGAVRVDSRPGAGATFVVELPLQVTH
ncbi:MAG TPA: HAMP domain-containing sensor histidine kinase [Polyangia bacterium]|nr:HAMP domain-containing sensor histidine kinase [Polyangia bacterium]